MLRSLEVY